MVTDPSLPMVSPAGSTYSCCMWCFTSCYAVSLLLYSSSSSSSNLGFLSIPWASNQARKSNILACLRFVFSSTSIICWDSEITLKGSAMCRASATAVIVFVDSDAVGSFYFILSVSTSCLASSNFSPSCDYSLILMLTSNCSDLVVFLLFRKPMAKST